MVGSEAAVTVSTVVVSSEETAESVITPLLKYMLEVTPT